MSFFDVVSVGAAVQDIFLQSRAFEETRNVQAPDGFDACLPLGSKINVDHLNILTGGGATNAATTFARLGLRAACIARVGQDVAGDMIRGQLEKEKISTIGLQEDKHLKTACSIIILSGHGHRAILTHRGSSRAISESAIPWKKLDTGCLYITSLGGNIDLLRELFLHAERKQIDIAWNPGNAELEWGQKKLKPFLQRTAVLILNREEAAHLTERPTRHLTAIFSELEHHPDQFLVVTNGGQGAYVRHHGQTLFAPALKARRVNTTGAGDAFGSAFVAALLKNKDVTAALRIAMLNATGVISHMGAKAGILTKMPSLMAQGRVRIRSKFS